MRIAVEPSAVAMSPYRYLYIFLTPEEHEGKHIIVSNAAEYGETGFLVGSHEHYEAESTDVKQFDTFDLAMEYLEELLKT
jgi:hypothetical protein